MKDSQQYLKVFMEAPLGICMLDGPDHVFTMANNYYLNILLCGRDLLGKTVRQAVPEAADQGFLELLDNVYKSGESFVGKEIPLCLRQSNGQEKDFFVNFVFQATRNDGGAVNGIIVVVNDVTEQVTASKQVESDANLLRLITDRLPAFVSYMDVSRRYRLVNKTYADWFGKSISQIEGKSREELVNHQSTYNYLLPYEEKAFSGTPVSFELTLTKSNGDFVNLDTEYLPDIDPVSGKVRGIIAVGQNVTDRELSLKAIEASEQRYRSLTDTIPQLMWTSTADGLVNYANERCLQYTGITSQQKYGDGWTTTIYADDLPRVGAAWMTSMKLGVEFKEEYRLRRHDGVYRWFLGRAIPIKNPDGSTQYWIGTATDIEEEKRIAEELRAAKEAAEEANATKSAFLANMSHEIRTPLGAILGFSGLLKDPALSTQDRNQYIETINRNGQSLTRIIDDILDLAKVEAGLLDVEEINFSLFGLMTEVVELFKEKSNQKNIYLFLNIDENVPSHISSDPTRLRQILINTIGNAVKFTETGGVRVSVRAKTIEDDTLRIAIEVKDTGRGLTSEQNERLFKPFTQADNTTTRRFGGTGLGLALSKRLSQALGGDIHVADSAPGKGSTFVVGFLATAVNSPDQPVKASLFKRDGTTDKRPLSGIKILLVDDSPDNQFLVKRVLVKNGATVELASNGLEAVEKATDGEHDVVLMDIQMPEMDGYQATKTLLERGYKKPIIALTAHAMIEERAKTKAAGFAGHLTKPLNNQELIELVAHLSSR